MLEADTRDRTGDLLITNQQTGSSEPSPQRTTGPLEPADTRSCPQQAHNEKPNGRAASARRRLFYPWDDNDPTSRPRALPEKGLPIAGTWVYFLQSFTDRNLIKIGTAKNLKNRIQDLRAGFPCPVWVIAYVPGDKHYERRLHDALADFRQHGEWFRPVPEVHNAIKDAVRAAGAQGKWVAYELIEPSVKVARKAVRP